MSQHYLFNEPGSIPGIPGTFANCRVDVDDEGNLTERPLVAIETSGSADVSPAVTQASEAAPSEVVQELARVAPTPFFTEG